MSRVRLAFLLLGLAFLFLALGRVGLDPFVQAAVRIGAGFALILCMNILWYFTDAVALSIVVRGHSNGPAATIGRVLLAQVCGEAMNNATPFMNLGGEPLKGVLIGAYTGGTAAAAALIADNVIKYLATATFVALGFGMSLFLLDLPFGVQAPMAAGLGALIAVVGTFAFFLPRGPLERLVRLGRRLRLPIRDTLGSAAVATDLAMARFYHEHRGSFVAAFGWHFLSRLLATADAWLVLWFLGVDASAFAALWILSMSILVNLVFSFIPLAIGASEGAHFFVFSALGLAPETGVVFAMIGRIRGIVWIAIGLIALAMQRTRGGDA